MSRGWQPPCWRRVFISLVIHVGSVGRTALAGIATDSALLGSQDKAGNSVRVTGVRVRFRLVREAGQGLGLGG